MRPLDYCLGKPETSGSTITRLFSVRVKAARKAAASSPTTFQRIFQNERERNTTYLFQIVHSGIFSLSTFSPLNRSAVRPASAPDWPLLRSPLGDEAGAAVRFPSDTTGSCFLCSFFLFFFLTHNVLFKLAENDWVGMCHKVNWLLKHRGRLGAADARKYNQNCRNILRFEMWGKEDRNI